MPGLPDIPTGIENQANAALEAVADALADKQSDYLAANGRYWQGAQSASPSDGANASHDHAAKPNDQDEDWSDFGVTLAADVVGISVFTHSGPLGHGYTARGHVSIAGSEYIRSIGVGFHAIDSGGVWADVGSVHPTDQE